MNAAADKTAFVEKLTREPLRWIQPKRLQPQWELWSGDQMLATLASSQGIRGILGLDPRLTASSPGGEWEIVQSWSGFDLRRAGEETPLLQFRGLLGMLATNGRVTAGADEFSWHSHLHLWRQSSFELLNASEFPLLRVEPRRAMLRSEGTVTIEDTGRRHRQIEPLTILAWALATSSGRQSPH